MKRLGKAVITTAFAAAVLIGGGSLLVHTQAFADTSGSASVQNDGTSTSAQSGTNGGFGHHGGKGQRKGFERGGFGDLLQTAATALNTDEKTLMDSMHQGKTLVQLAEAQGVSEDALLQKLTDAETKSISDALSAGKLTQDQADKQKSNMAQRLKEFVENAGPGHGRRGGMHGGGQHFGPWGDSQALSQILGMTPDELRTELQAGKSPADVAQEKGISEDQLISKLKDSMNDKLKQFVERKGKPQAADSQSAGK